MMRVYLVRWYIRHNHMQKIWICERLCHTYLIIKFAQFEEGDLLSENHDNTESGEKSDVGSTLPPFISEEEIDALDSGNESDAEPMSTDMLEIFCVGSQAHPIINKREALYKIRYCIKQGQAERKGELLST